MTDQPIAVTPGAMLHVPDLVTVPRDALLDIADLIGGMFPEQAQRILDLPVSRHRDPGLRLVKITDGEVTTKTVTYPRGYIEGLPDPMTVIERAVREWKSRGGMVTTESLLVGIRAALERTT